MVTPKDSVEKIAKQIVDRLNDKYSTNINFDDDTMSDIYKEIAGIIALETPKAIEEFLKAVRE